jgi:hypothetical protein
VTKTPPDRRHGIATIDRLIKRFERRLTAVLLRTTPRRDSFVLLNIATGTATTRAVTWQVPITTDDYAITVSVTCAAAAVGLLTAGVQPGSRTPTGCTIVVANRTGVELAAATFDVLAQPL